MIALSPGYFKWLINAGNTQVVGEAVPQHDGATALGGLTVARLLAVEVAECRSGGCASSVENGRV
jgi:hypothetical protein